MLMLSSKIKLSYAILKHTWKTFVADVFMIKRFLHSLFFDCSTLLLINELIFEKTQNTSESIFLQDTVEHL